MAENHHEHDFHNPLNQPTGCPKCISGKLAPDDKKLLRACIFGASRICSLINAQSISMLRCDMRSYQQRFSIDDNERTREIMETS